MTFFPCFEYFFNGEPSLSKFLTIHSSSGRRKVSTSKSLVRTFTYKQNIISLPFTKCTEYTKCFGYNSNADVFP